MNQHSRTELLLGGQALKRLSDAHVLIVGLGGVGGYTAEMLCRAGVGNLTIADGDTVSLSNINRQLIAFHSTVGQSKVRLFAQRFHDINPQCNVNAIDTFIRDDETVNLLQSAPFDYVVDAIDTLSPKVFLIYHACQLDLPVVSSMGSAGRMDPSVISVTDISRSNSCPLARAVRKRLHRLGIDHGVKVVFSTETVNPESVIEEPSQNKRTTIGTISYLPAMFGCHIAATVIQDIISQQ